MLVLYRHHYLKFIAPFLAIWMTLACVGWCFDAKDLALWKITGYMGPDGTVTHSGSDAAIKLYEGCRGFRMVRDEDGLGKVTFWIYDDGEAYPSVNQKQLGPGWGIIQKDGSSLTIGPARGSDRYVATWFYDEKLPDRGSQGPRGDGLVTSTTPLDVARKAGWTKWDFVFDAANGFTLLKDDKPVQLDWNQSLYLGFRGVTVTGDDPGWDEKPIMIWMDDVSVQTGPAITEQWYESKNPWRQRWYEVKSGGTAQRSFTLATNVIANTGTAPLSGTAAPPVINSKLATKVQGTTYLVKTDKGSGTGFFARFRNQVYFVTNFHVVQGATTIECINPAESFAITTGKLAVANDRDLVCFPAGNRPALEVNANPTAGLAVSAFGNSGGEDVVTKLDGKVLAIAPDQVEVSCEFIPGNSGGPITDEDGNVVGISTYVAKGTAVPDWAKKQAGETQDTRRFGVRLTDSINWTVIDLAQFKNESKELERAQGVEKDFENMLNAIEQAPFQALLEADYASGPDITQFMQDYNRQCKDVQSQADRWHDGASALNQKYHKKIRDALGKLALLIDDTVTMTESGNRIPFSKSEFGKVTADMRKTSDYIKQNIDKLSKRDIFRDSRDNSSQ